MGKLNADRGVLALHEGDQRLETFDLGIAPDAEIVLVDQAHFLDTGRLDKDKPEAAERVTAEMHEVEGAAGVAGLGAIMNHRRHDQAVFQRQAANGEGLKKPWPPRAATVRSVTQWRLSPARLRRKMARKWDVINRINRA